MDLNLNIRDKLGQPFALATVQETKRFLEAEQKYWLEQKSRLGSKLVYPFDSYPQQIENFLVALRTHEDALKQNPQPVNIQQQKQSFESAKSQFSSVMAQNWLYRGNPCTEALLNAFEYSKESGEAFWNAVSTNDYSFQNNRTSFPSLIGLIMAYEFKLQDQSQIVKRRHAEKKSFYTLRDDLEAERNVQVANFEEFRQDYLSWQTATKDELNDWFSDCKERSDTTITEQASQFSQMVDEANKRQHELEKLYVEKLRLEKPAMYWQNRAKSLRTQGLWWSGALASVLAGGIWYFTYLFTHWLKGTEMTVSLHSLQGVVLLAVIISAYGYCVKVLSRLVFSAFHLQRDAEERQQLTYVYLALSNENHADEESRKIILQALFSRSESGLLVNESGPTMPAVDGLASLLSKSGKS